VNTDRITVLLADDHALVRRGFRRIIEDDPDLEVVGEASTGDEAVAMFTELKPQVVVMDAAMPGTSGLAATRAILAGAPDATILMLSMHSEETLVRQALAAGETVLDPSVVRPAPLAGERTPRLTPRETEVLQLICDGLSNKEIAAKLELSVNTIAVHRANIMNALGVHKTAELVVYALQNGLVNPL